ncbi:BrnA antitoxin family protein [Kamptonema sp. UHCC 0994]|uniref:BrnA antitoxin family protein n=1 Tax=Kamptonema sp. UHCC 0994 TaxID=3031329 RepID=UPI0031BA1A25
MPTITISPKRLEELKNIPENDIDTCDIPELDASFWEKAELVKPLTKQAISLRIDSDVLDWFKSQGKGYQSLMNAVLRSYVEHHVKSSQ